MSRYAAANANSKRKYYQAVEKQASGRQPRRAAFWKAQHIIDM
jgi:hypothetical protein